jgi:hypothetical protein
LRAVEALEALADGSLPDRPISPLVTELEEMIYEAGKRAEDAQADYYADAGTCSCGYCPATPAAAARGAALNPDGDAELGYRLLEMSEAAGVIAAAGEALCLLLESSHDAVGVVEKACFLPLDQVGPVLHELFGNPFRPVVLDPRCLAWNDRCVERVAHRIYDERRFTDLPILADALEDAGCDIADILAHCRGPGPHLRGCWVVDLLLGKS